MPKIQLRTHASLTTETINNEVERKAEPHTNWTKIVPLTRVEKRLWNLFKFKYLILSIYFDTFVSIAKLTGEFSCAFADFELFAL